MNTATAAVWVAGYAATVATATLIRQILTEWRSSRPRLKLALIPVKIAGLFPDGNALGIPVEADKTSQAGVQLSITNVQKSPVHVVKVGLEQDASGERTARWDLSEPLDVPFWLQAGEQKSTFLTDQEVYGCTAEGTFRLKVGTATSPKEFQVVAEALKDGVAIVAPEYYAELASAAEAAGLPRTKRISVELATRLPSPDGQETRDQPPSS